MYVKGDTSNYCNTLHVPKTLSSVGIQPHGVENKPMQHPALTRA